MKIISTVIYLLFFLSGCATTNVSSFIDPEYANEIYKMPIVWGRIAPLEDRQKLEGGIVAKFSSKGINAILGTAVFPPTRDITKEFIASALSKTEGDSLLIVALKEGSSIYSMKYEATLYGKSLHKVWVGSVVTKLQSGGFSESQKNDAVFDSTAHGIVDQIMKDGVIK